MKKKPLLLFLFVFYIYCVSAQTPQFKVSGRICDQDELPVDGAVVTCLSLPDSIVIDNVVGDSEGYFALLLDSKYEGRCMLEISCIGYSKSNISELTEDMAIELTRTATMLENFTVISQATLERRPGRFLYTPAANDFVKSINAYDLLMVTPLVKVEQDEISILGKTGTQIYINGRPPVMDQKSVIEMLRSMSADRIKRVEIITQPNSGYWASYTGGIINIVIKPALSETLNGRASAYSYYSTERYSPGVSIYLAYENKKWNASLSSYLQSWNSRSERVQRTEFYETGVTIDNINKDSSNYLYGGASLNLSYKPTDKSTIGGSVSLSVSQNKGEATHLSDYYTNGVFDYTVKSVNQVPRLQKKPLIGVGLYYKLDTDDNGGGLDMNLRYRHLPSPQTQLLSYYRLQSDSDFEMYDMFRQLVVYLDDTYEAKIKYVVNFDKNNTLDFGFEHVTTFMDNDFVRETWNGDDFENDPTQTNNFKYDEHLSALFANYERVWSKVFSTTIGLRGEYTSVKGVQRITGESFARNYFNLFPNLGVVADLGGGKHNLSLGLAKNIYRPSSWYLNPFRFWNSADSYSMGNTGLREVVYYESSLMYMFLHDYILGVNYAFGDNSIQHLTLPGDIPNTTVSSVYNIGRETFIGISSSVNKSFFEGVWKPSLSIDTYYATLSGSVNGESLDSRYWVYYWRLSNTIRLSEKGKCFLSVSYAYSSPDRQLKYKSASPNHYLNINLTKRFDFGGTLELGASGLIDYDRSGTYFYDSMSIYSNTLTKPLTLSVSFSYSFGNNNVRGAKDASSSVVSDRRK